MITCAVPPLDSNARRADRIGATGPSIRAQRAIRRSPSAWRAVPPKSTTARHSCQRFATGDRRTIRRGVLSTPEQAATELGIPPETRSSTAGPRQRAAPADAFTEAVLNGKELCLHGGHVVDGHASAHRGRKLFLDLGAVANGQDEATMTDVPEEKEAPAGEMQ